MDQTIMLDSDVDNKTSVNGLNYDESRINHQTACR